MFNEITVNASTLHKALKLGSRELGLKIKDVDYIILKKENIGLFKKSIKVRIFKKPDSDDIYADTRSRDGYFRIQYRDGYAYLVVFPPKTFGRPVYSDDVINRFRLLNINFLNVMAIDKIIENADGIARKIIKWPEGIKILSKVKFDISGDNLTAYAAIKPPAYAEGEIDEKYFMKLIREQGIIYGIKTDNIREAVSKKFITVIFLLLKAGWHLSATTAKPGIISTQSRASLIL